MLNLKEKLIEILVKSKSIPKEKLDSLIELQRKKNTSLRTLLLNEKIISEQELLSVLSEYLFLPSLHLGKYKFDPKIIALVPEQLCRRYTIIPLARMGNTLTVAVTDPLNIFVLDDLTTLTGCQVDIILSPEEEIKKAIDANYRKDDVDLQKFLDEMSEDSPKETDADFKEADLSAGLELTEVVRESQAPPIVKLVDLILIQALKQRSSDIHLEPEEECLRVRYRIDGNLQDALKLPKENQNAVLARLKIISNMNITESRLPQDGRFKVRLGPKEIDFRVSALPTTFGQKFVLRALDKSNLAIGLDKLGFSEQPLCLFKEAIAHPFGIILVTGPTGSGKSTTLYSILNRLNQPERNIITIEDPVEYELEGITQVHVRHEIGLDFASGLRSILRQSPDIIMVGEIRDSETADIAIKAALTGQLILSTLHTNDAVSSITRLMDMGIEPFLVASSLIMACAQRLCRMICSKCRQSVDASEKLMKEFGIKEKFPVYQAKGCDYCNHSGYYGRIAILEVLMIDDYIRQLIIKKGSLEEIREYAVKNKGMLTLRDDALTKVRQGLTTLDEALRITTEE
ncbi:MAG: GspE/PulE family protein [Candidatus Omnitrophica bacterium]|nr:GspE/PulE family protein [Candidatus Omnitrophota bacterium]MBU1871983.1 GspE/PulE family protein [Candidatus Omnitrophota bacterium]